MKRAFGKALSIATRLAWPYVRLRGRPLYGAPIPKQNRRILILAAHWIGDNFWASQTLPLLMKRWPSCQFYAATKHHSRDLWHDLIDPEHRLLLPELTSDRKRESVQWTRLIATARSLQEQQWDGVIDLMGNRYSALFGWLTAPRWFLGFDGNELGWLYSHRARSAEDTNIHLADRPLHVIAPLLGEIPKLERLRAPTTSASFNEVAKETGLDPNRPFSILVPGAGWKAKEWPAENFQQCASSLARQGIQIVAMGSPKQEALCRSILDDVPAKLSLVSTHPIGQACALIAKARSVLCNDSAIGHMSAAHERRTVVIFTGATKAARCLARGPKVDTFDSSLQSFTTQDVVECLLKE